MVLDGAQGAGHEFELVFLEPGRWPADLSDAGFDVEVLPAGQLRQLHRAVQTVARLARIMRARQPDLILNWMGKAHLYSAPAAVLAGMGDRLVWWQHDIPRRHWLDRCATVLPAVAVGASSRASAEAQARMWPSRQTFVVAPGARVPEPSAETPPLEIPDGVPVIGIVGRLQPWKGQDRLLRAQALLRERGHPTHTLIVGGDAHGLSPDYARALPGLVSALGLEGSVTMTGQVPDAGPYIDRMDILVNASDPEPFGIVLLEGMAREVAVLAVNRGGPAEIVEDQRTGVLARSGEPEALADALETLLTSPRRRRDMARAGHERFTRQFTDIAMRTRFFSEMEALAQLVNDGATASPNTAAPCPVTIVAHDIGAVGGMERQLVELVMGLRRRGHAVTVIARTCVLPAGSGVRFHRVPGPRRPFLLFYAWFMLAGSLAVWRWRDGVVQATGAIVLNPVDTVAIHFCHAAHRRTAPTRLSLLQRCNLALGGLVKRAAERLCVRVNPSATYVCVSEGLAEEMRAHYPQIAGNVVTIHNGVDTDSFSPAVGDGESRAAARAKLGIPAERLVAAFVGGEWGRKGLRCAIEALALAPEWDLAVAGAGDRDSYQELADSLGVGGAIHWLGVVSDVHAVYKLADAFVLPSSYETFSLVTFEAAASGLPVLATPVNGVRELIRDGENGFLIEVEPAGVAARLNELAADPELRRRLGAAARSSALAFTWDDAVAKHEALYERLARQAVV